tara:strand:+ start:1073 stop:2020 length:948 start_codon:yes stop_codon:yes gene_type:complete
MKTIGCVIPCFKGNEITLDIIKKSLKIVDYVVLVDDCCPNKTGEIALKNITNEKFILIKNESNQGVGAAVKKGINYLLSIDCDIIVKIDADGQINPLLIPEIIQPLIISSAEAVKGNRFTSVENMISMPFLRIIGNLGLSFLNKVSSGYWELFDPTNGFMAFKASTLKKIRLNKTDNRYFFESDLLFQCSLANVYFQQYPMQSIYKSEISSLKPLREISRFSRLHLINFCKRLIYQYFILDFNAGSLELIGFCLFSCSAIYYYIFTKYFGIIEGINASPTQANLLAILIIISFQLLISFIFYDSTQKPLMRRIKD